METILALELLKGIDQVSWEFWSPLLTRVRGQEGFKEMVRERGILDYWQEFGWSEFCRPIGENDFECL